MLIGIGCFVIRGGLLEGRGGFLLEFLVLVGEGVGFGFIGKV